MWNQSGSKEGKRGGNYEQFWCVSKFEIMINVCLGRGSGMAREIRCSWWSRAKWQYELLEEHQRRGTNMENALSPARYEKLNCPESWNAGQ